MPVYLKPFAILSLRNGSQSLFNNVSTSPMPPKSDARHHNFIADWICMTQVDILQGARLPLNVMTLSEDAQSLVYISSDDSRVQGRSYLTCCLQCEQLQRPKGKKNKTKKNK